MDLARQDADDLAAHGEERLTWVRARMRLLEGVRRDFEERRPFEGARIGVGLHIEPKTAVPPGDPGRPAARGLRHGQPRIDAGRRRGRAAARGIRGLRRRDDSLETHLANLHRTLDAAPSILLDNGGDLP
jgi:adenosylhomocysteinase